VRLKALLSQMLAARPAGQHPEQMDVPHFTYTAPNSFSPSWKREKTAPVGIRSACGCVIDMTMPFINVEWRFRKGSWSLIPLRGGFAVHMLTGWRCIGLAITRRWREKTLRGSAAWEGSWIE
jgi:hypothetical protein